MMASQTVLFICSGNYYRSRFAEAVFNHRARQAGLAWGAFSRGLRMRERPAPLAPETVAALQARGIPVSMTAPGPALLSAGDFAVANLVVALKEDEHREALAREYPGWEKRACFWNIHDIDVETAEVALPKLEAQVVELVELLRSGCAPGLAEVGRRSEF